MKKKKIVGWLTSPAENGGSNGGKAGQHTQTAFRTLKRTNRPPEDGKPRGHTIEKGDNERQPNWQNLIKGNSITSGPNTKRKVGKAGDDVRGAFASWKRTRGTQEHGERSVCVEERK